MARNGISASKLRRDVSELVREYGLVNVLAELKDAADRNADDNEGEPDEEVWDDLSDGLDAALEAAHELPPDAAEDSLSDDRALSGKGARALGPLRSPCPAG